jgi:hypothetical protein
MSQSPNLTNTRSNDKVVLGSLKLKNPWWVGTFFIISALIPEEEHNDRLLLFLD